MKAEQDRRRTEIVIQTTEKTNRKPTEKPTQDRVKLLEMRREETEQELKCLYDTLNEVKALKDKMKPNTTASQELQAFIKKLITEIEINTGIKDEFSQSIEFIKTGVTGIDE